MTYDKFEFTYNVITQSLCYRLNLVHDGRDYTLAVYDFEEKLIAIMPMSKEQLTHFSGLTKKLLGVT